MENEMITFTYEDGDGNTYTHGISSSLLFWHDALEAYLDFLNASGWVIPEEKIQEIINASKSGTMHEGK